MDLIEATAIGGFSVRLRFDDGSEGVVDLRPLLNGPIFEPLIKDRELFAAVAVDPELGTVVWPNGADMDPDTLHELSRSAATNE